MLSMCSAPCQEFPGEQDPLGICPGGVSSPEEVQTIAKETKQ